MLAYSRDREPEWQVRTAIGAAGGGRLLGGLAAGAIVATTALTLALPLARAGLVWMEGQIWQSEDPSPYFLHLDLTRGAVGVGLAAATMAALLAGLLPMLLPGVGPGPTSTAAFTRTTGSRRAARLAGGLVATQMALSLTIVVVMSVLVQAVQAMGHREVGARHMDLLTARLSLSAERYPSAESRERFWATLVERLRQTPGALDATAGTAVPGFRGDDETARVEGGESGRDLLRVSSGTVDEHFLTAYGIRLNEGRDFTDRDAAAAAAIVDHRFAQAAWPGREAVGRRIRVDRLGDEWLEVVGVVDNLHLAQVDDPPRPSVLLYLGAVRPSSASVAVRTTGRPYDALPTLQGVVTSLDPDLPAYSVYSLEDAIVHGHANVRIAVRVLAWLGACGLLVAAAGLYAMLAVRVTERTREIGVRRAVGASTLGVARAVLQQAVVPLAAGSLAGVALAWPVASRLVALEPTVISMGPASFGWSAIVLVTAAALAIVAPLARAIAIDPMAALREG
jgi:predicted permease